MAFPTVRFVEAFAEANWTGDWWMPGYRATSASHSSSCCRAFLRTHSGLQVVPHHQDSSPLPTTALRIYATSRRQQDPCEASLHILTSEVGTPEASPNQADARVPISVSSSVRSSRIEGFLCRRWSANSIAQSN
jgi:hypothetical protein